VRWFNSFSVPEYTFTWKISKPKVFIENGIRYINLSGTHLHLHKEFKPLNSYSKDIQDNVQYIWNHIKKMWCSKKEDQFKYVQNWISNVVVGKRMNTCIYLQAPHGIGKSMIIRFLKNHVIGKDLYQPYSKVSPFLNFNGSLMGKLLVVFEEVPTYDSYEWKLFTDRLKYYITEDTLDIEMKFKEIDNVPNIVSFMIITNNYNAIKLTPDDHRHFFMPDAVYKPASNDYYALLLQYTNDPIVGEAFYMHCKEIVSNNPKFNEFVKPDTKTFKDTISDNVSSTYKFIRETYIMNHLGIDMKFKDLYTEYLDFCSNHSIKKIIKKMPLKRNLLRLV
jgi:hypothetical protein